MMKHNFDAYNSDFNSNEYLDDVYYEDLSDNYVTNPIDDTESSNDELVIITDEPVKNHKNNKYIRKMKQNQKDTKLANDILASGFKYRARWIGSRNGEDPYKLKYIKNLIGSGFFIKSCRSGAHSFYKKYAAKRVRQNLKKSMFYDEGNIYKKIGRHIAYEII